MMTLPRLLDNLEINKVEDGYVIYQAERDRVHYLNHTAVLVLECCTGKNSIEEIENVVKEAYNLGQAPKAEIEECLKSLYEEGLIE